MDSLWIFEVSNSIRMKMSKCSLVWKSNEYEWLWFSQIFMAKTSLHYRKEIWSVDEVWDRDPKHTTFKYQVVMILLFLQKFKGMNVHNIFEKCSKFSVSFFLNNG